MDGLSIDRQVALAGAETTAVERGRATRYVAGRAKDADDLVLLLQTLGLDASEGKAP